MDNFDSKTDHRNLEFLSNKQFNHLLLPSLKSVILTRIIPRLPVVSRPNVLVPFAGLLLAMVLLSGFELATSEVTVALLDKNFNERLNDQLTVSSAKGKEFQRYFSVMMTSRTIDLSSGVAYFESTITNLNEKTRLIKNEAGFLFAEWPTIVLLATEPILVKIENWAVGLKSFEHNMSANFVASRDNLWWAKENLDFRGLSLALTSTPKIDFSDWRAKLSIYENILSTNISYYWERIIANWQNFINPPETKEISIDQTLLREQIKADILAELKSNQVIDNSTMTPLLTPKVNNTGLVILPEKSATNTQSFKNQVGQVFSDQVSVEFDQSGQSGIITPIFKTKTGNSYIFLLTPIKE